MTQRHSWGSPTRFQFKTERQCLNFCGIIKVTRHENDNCWTEFWRGLDKIEGDRTPACCPVMALEEERAA